MRFLVVLIAIASACDLQPAPKKGPATATVPTPAPVADSNAPAAAPIDAGVPVALSDAPTAPRAPIDAMIVSDRCVTLGSHVAEIMLNEAGDPSKQAALIQDRAKIVRRTAENCTRDAWNEALIGCFLAAKTQNALQACRKPDAPRPPAPPVPDGPAPR